MPVRFLLGDEAFPDPSRAAADGLVAVGGDLAPERLLDAYRRGIFPWYEQGQPILWYSPDPRFVLRAGDLRISRSLRRRLADRPYEVRLDTAFRSVIEACAATPRPGQGGTWITDDMVRAYTELHRLGWAHSAEAWLDGRLVGGLYGVSIGGLFCGESMFAWADDASKIAFVALVRQLQRWGIETIDCQVPTDHLARFGARPWPRREFLRVIAELAARPSRGGPWTLDADLPSSPFPEPGRPS